MGERERITIEVLGLALIVAAVAVLTGSFGWPLLAAGVAFLGVAARAQ